MGYCHSCAVFRYNSWSGTLRKYINIRSAVSDNRSASVIHSHPTLIDCLSRLFYFVSKLLFYGTHLLNEGNSAFYLSRLLKDAIGIHSSVNAMLNYGLLNFHVIVPCAQTACKHKLSLDMHELVVLLHSTEGFDKCS